MKKCEGMYQVRRGGALSDCKSDKPQHVNVPANQLHRGETLRIGHEKHDNNPDNFLTPD